MATPAFRSTSRRWAGARNETPSDVFEQGPRSQARELRLAYRFLLGNRRRLRLAAVYWFSWKDLPGSCDFCDSAGLFRGGEGFDPKPAWQSFVHITRSRRRP